MVMLSLSVIKIRKHNLSKLIAKLVELDIIEKSGIDGRWINPTWNHQISKENELGEFFFEGRGCKTWDSEHKIARRQTTEPSILDEVDLILIVLIVFYSETKVHFRHATKIDLFAIVLKLHR